MKIKGLVKAATKSKEFEFSNDYDLRKNIILIDGVFTPFVKAREDNRKVDSFVIKVHDSSITLDITSFYIPENAVPKIDEVRMEKKKNKKKKEDKKKESKKKKKDK